jgi:hypothetical protein
MGAQRSIHLQMTTLINLAAIAHACLTQIFEQLRGRSLVRCVVPGHLWGDADVVQHSGRLLGVLASFGQLIHSLLQPCQRNDRHRLFGGLETLGIERFGYFATVRLPLINALLPQLECRVPPRHRFVLFG